MDRIGDYNTTTVVIQSKDVTTKDVTNTPLVLGLCLCGVALVIFILSGALFVWSRRRWKQTKPKRTDTPRASPLLFKKGSTPRASPLLFRKCARQDGATYVTSDSIDYSYADLPIVDCSNQDSVVADLDTKLQRFRKINENIQRAVPMPPRHHGSRSSPDVTGNDVSQAMQPLPVANVARSRPSSNPLIAALAVNQSLASWPSRQSSAASDAQLRFNRNRQHDHIGFQRSIVDQCTQTGRTHSTDSNRWSTSIDVITSSASYDQSHHHHILEDPDDEIVPLLSSGFLKGGDHNDQSVNGIDDSCDETQLLKPVPADEDYIQNAPNVTRRRRSTLTELHHMAFVHVENMSEELDQSNDETEEKLTQSNDATEEMCQSNYVDEELAQSHQGDNVTNDRTALPGSSVEPLAQLQVLHTLISQKDRRLRRKEVENVSLKQKIIQLTESIEQKDRQIRDINSYIAEMMQNFPQDRNSFQLPSEQSITDPITQEHINIDSNTEETPLIYYSKRNVNDAM